MENRFKFRCWDLESKSMLDDVSPRDYDAPWCILMQCSGFVDKTDESIYEGDIVKADLDFEADGRVNLIGKIVFEKGAFCYSRLDMKDVYELKNYHNLKKLGNIYENPALLNKEAL